MRDPLFLGIDGGGTRCRARLRDESGRMLGEGTGGAANINLDPALVWKSILNACKGALAQAALDEGALRNAHAGLGLAGSSQRRAAERILAYGHPFKAVTLTTDAHIAWLGAFGGKDGAILILGTGSCGYAVIQGRRHYVGGWGFQVSDEGSGAALGRELLRRTIWAQDGRIAATPLSNAVGAQIGDCEAISDWAGQARPADYARFAPMIVEHARRGDRLGLALVEEAAAAIAVMAQRLVALGSPGLCLVGGLAEPLRPWLPSSLDHAIVAPVSDAMDGAIALARQAVSGGRVA